ncbi:MAG: hypothetical protein V7K37_18465 [Nostoc sp.]
MVKRELVYPCWVKPEASNFSLALMVAEVEKRAIIASTPLTGITK